ncbi:SAP domain-containing protein [Plectosphaerella plurivora]|uniref:SAP domain-containing protein n=1 Tax=Plectosphaerella plurivora TaxID=936078 RepID=A0A9P8VD17_9PEZI|nr:SAP domain-containing protein [Plectosphaerella plurivora]
MRDYGKQKVAELRAELRSRGLQTSGLKQELVQRLLDDDTTKSSHETDEPARGHSPTTHTTDDDGIVASDQEVQAVAGIEHVAETTTQPSPLDTREEDLNQLQKRKRRSTTPPPDPKRSKANVPSPSGPASSPRSHKVNDSELLISAPATNTPDASDGCTAPPSQHRGNSAGSPEDGDPATTVSTPVHPSDTGGYTEPSGMLGGIHSPRQTHMTDPALHPPTRALYIRELMRPLRDDKFKAHLVHVSTSTQEDDNNVGPIELYYTNHIKTHAFVVFSDTSKAIRARSALHNVVWPQECNRKPLWVDFVPVEEIQGWIAEEQQSEKSTDSKRDTAKRWEVRYSSNTDGNAHVTFGQVHEPARPESSSHMHLRFTNLRFAPAQVSDNANAVPLGPRKSRLDAGNEISSRPTAFSDGPVIERSSYPVQAGSNGRLKATRSEPSISYQKVATGLASRRIRAMRSHYTRHSDRKLGKDDEINRYSFESEDTFVDRGKENFVGIRPPNRDARRYILRDGTQQPYRRRSSPPQRMANQARGSGRYPSDAVNDMPRRGFGRDSMAGGFGTGANDIPIGHSHRFQQRD